MTSEAQGARGKPQAETPAKFKAKTGQKHVFVLKNRRPRIARSNLIVEVVDQHGRPLDAADVAIDGTNTGVTPASGTVERENLSAGVYRVEALRDGYRRTDQLTNLGEAETARVRFELVRLKAKLVWPVKDAAHKQFVNLVAGRGHPERGSKIGIKIKIEDGKVGDKIYFKLAFDAAAVSKRNTPARAVVGGVTAPAWCPQGGKELTLTADDQQFTVEVEIGLSGGDVYTIAVGATRECTDEICTVTNWRKLWYEVMAPDFMNLAGDIGARHQARVRDLLRPCFIEYAVHKAHIFPEASAPAGSVFTAAYFKVAGRKRFVLTDHTFTVYPTTNGTWDGAKRPQSVGLRLCDYNYFNENGAQVISKRFTTKKKRFEVLSVARRYILPTSANDGSHAVKTVTWTAQVNPVTHPAHPGVHVGAARTGHLHPVNDVKFVNIECFEVELPDGTAANPGPGRLVGAAVTATHCPILVEVEFEAADAGLGLAGSGAQSGENLVCYKESAPQTTVDVMIHEFCHSAGMAVIGGTAAPPGLAVPKTTSQVDPDNLDAASTRGHLYTGHGHSGGHCARGLSDAQKAAASYAGRPGTCINYGENSLVDPSQRTEKICPTCALVLKARELTAI